MAVCKNCGVTMSCGCQKRVAKNGKDCCSKCVTRENQVYAKQQIEKRTKPLGGISGVSVTATIKK
tara:strand:+ start:269 stop:463 length:195 start_codon:yes stop_codon:yes gene_type:complete